MTLDEFNNTGWCSGMRCKYKGDVRDIGGCDFNENLVALVVELSEDLLWVRCENIDLIRQEASDE